MALTANPDVVVAAASQPGIVQAPAGAFPGAPANAPVLAPPTVKFTDVRNEALRRSLAAEQTRLAQLLSPEWQNFLALPDAAINPGARPNPADLAATYSRYQQIAADPRYASLVQRPEFQSTMELLGEYATAIQAQNATLQLPAPPPLPGQR